MSRTKVFGGEEGSQVSRSTLIEVPLLLSPIYLLVVFSLILYTYPAVGLYTLVSQRQRLCGVATSRVVIVRNAVLPIRQNQSPPATQGFAMDLIANGTTFTSPLANAQLKLQAASASGIVGRIVAQCNVWTVLFTILALLVTYDQCKR